VKYGGGFAIGPPVQVLAGDRGEVPLSLHVPLDRRRLLERQ
jgi:hypothetical protein